MADLFSGHSQRIVAGAKVLSGSPEVLPRLLEGLAQRPQHERARIVWVLSQMGEAGRSAVLQLGPAGFRDLLYRLRECEMMSDRRSVPAVLESFRSLKDEFFDFAIAELGRAGRNEHAHGTRWVLIALREPSLVPRLVTCLARTTSAEAASACAEALGKFDSAEAVGALITALGHPDEGVRKTVREALTGMGAPATSSLQAAFPRMSPEDGTQAVEAMRTLLSLGEGGVAAAKALGVSIVPALLRVAFHDGPSGHAYRGTFVGDSNPDLIRLVGLSLAVARPAVLARLESSSPGERAKAIRLLSEVGDTSSLPRLSAALEDGDAFVRIAALTGLGRLGGERETIEILESLADPEEEVREAAHWSLVILGERASAHLGRVAAGTDGATIASAPKRAAAARALCHMGEPGIVALRRGRPGSIGALRLCVGEHPSKEVMAAARRVAPRETYDALLEHVAGPDRENAAYRLAEFARAPPGDSEVQALDAARAAALLLPDLRDRCEWVRFVPAANALGALQAREAFDPLVRALRSARCHDWQSGNHGVPEAAAAALAEIGDVRAVRPLTALVRDVKAETTCRTAAANALRRIGDPEGLRTAQEYIRDPLFRQRQGSRGTILVSLYLLLGPAVVEMLRRRGAGDGWRWVFLFLGLALGAMLGLTAFGLPRVAWDVVRLVLPYAAGLVVLAALTTWLRVAARRALPETSALSTMLRTFAHGASYVAGGVVLAGLLSAALAFLSALAYAVR